MPSLDHSPELEYMLSPCGWLELDSKLEVLVIVPSGEVESPIYPPLLFIEADCPTEVLISLTGAGSVGCGRFVMLPLLYTAPSLYRGAGRAMGIGSARTWLAIGLGTGRVLAILLKLKWLSGRLILLRSGSAKL